MLFSIVVVGLLAKTVASSSLYKIPETMEVEASCTLPGNFTIENFTTYESKTNGTANTTSFHFIDSGTGIDTLCERNATSKSSTSSAGSTPRWPCDNKNVEFIFQTPGLTVIEAACPGSSTFEASGLADLTLNCMTLYSGTYCTATPASISDNFTSLEPRPSQ